MKVKLNKPVSLFGLEWPAGEHEIEDQFWAEALAQAAQQQRAGEEQPEQEQGEEQLEQEKTADEEPAAKSKKKRGE